ncbi:hypothetical protein NLU03_28515 [Bacillus toyonensis]|nr:hypothetical protein [Bacillus toyonensis]
MEKSQKTIKALLNKGGIDIEHLEIIPSHAKFKEILKCEWVEFNSLGGGFVGVCDAQAKSKESQKNPFGFRGSMVLCKVYEGNENHRQGEFIDITIEDEIKVIGVFAYALYGEDAFIDEEDEEDNRTSFLELIPGGKDN